MPQTVTVDNFVRAETDGYFAATVQIAGGIGRFDHRRDVMPVGHQTVIRANRDTLYSAAVFDLDAAPVTVTLPDAENRFMSMIVIDEDHYVQSVVYGAGQYTLSREQVGTRYVLAGIRTLVDPNDTADLERVHALQDAIVIDQASSGQLDLPDWDAGSQKKVHDALLTLSATVPDTKRMFGGKDQVDPIRHIIGTASGWGGNPERDAAYLTVTPEQNDGTTVHRLIVEDVPVDGFWSITVYNADGYLAPNERDAYALNNLTAARSADGAVNIQFGGCDDATPNCLPIERGWNYWVRLYRPRPEILDGTWTFPQATPIT